MYENVNEPFLIERGDEIRISYISGSNFEAVQQDFTVLDVGFTDYASGSADNAFITFNNSNLAGTGSSEIRGLRPIRQYNKIAVYPDPSTLTIPIPSGSINQCSFRKRRNADNTVNAISSPLNDSHGANN